MKKSILSLGLMLAALTLTNCSQNEEFDSLPTAGNGSFELFTQIDTRTANDGLSTNWVKNDAMSVFYAEANQSAYSSNHSFSIAEADLATGRFTGNLAEGESLDATKTYDWYAIYPYKEQINAPVNTNGYIYIGGKSNAAQKQTGNNSMAHICGSDYPLCGLAKGVAADQAPVLKMKHASCLVEVKVTNGLTEPLKVTDIAFTAVEDIQGSYYIDFSSENPSFKSSGDNYVSSTATLSVSNGEEIAVGESATFYFAVKPFEAAAGDELDLVISGTTPSGAGEHAANLSLSDDVEFVGGTIKTLNVTYSTAVEVLEKETWSLVSLVSEIKEGTYVILTKNANSGAISYLPNANASAGPAQCSTAAFDLVSTEVSTHLVTDDMRWTFTGTASAMKITNAAGSYLFATNANNGMRVGTTEDSWVITSNANNSAAFSLKDTAQNRYLTAYAASNWRCYTTDYAAKAYTTDSNGQNAEVYLYRLGTIERTPTLEVENTTIEEVHANGTEATFPVIAANLTEAVVVTCDQTVVTSATYADGHVSYTVGVNEGDAREGWIKLTSGSLEVTVTVKQNKVVSTKTLPYTESFGSSIGDFSIDNVELGGFNGNVWAWASGYGMKATAYVGGTRYNTEAWLVSPEINLETASSPILSFDHAQKYAGKASNELKVYAIAANGEKTELTVPTYPTGADWTFVSSGDISLAAFKGTTISIGFKYTSTTSTAATWEVKNFSVEDRKLNQSLSFSAGSLETTVGTDVTGLTVNGAKTTVTYTSSNTAVATVDAATGALTIVGAGNTTITATAAESDEYASASAKYTLTVNAAGVSHQTASLSFASTAQRTEFSTTKQVWQQNGITFTNNKAASSSSVADYSNPIRVYKSSEVIIEVGGKGITKVVFNCASGYADELISSTFADGTAVQNSNTVTVTLGSPVTSFKITAIGAATRFNSIEVTYVQE